MTDSLKKVKSGDRLQIPAQAYNAFVDAALDFRSRQHNVKTPPAGGWSSSGSVKIKNISGTDVGRFQVLGIDGVVFDPQAALQAFQSETIFTGNIPSLANHSGGRFVICAGPIPNGTIASAWASGICPVQVEITSESHACAEIVEGLVSNLTSVEGGSCQILWKEAGTGLKWALVRFGGSGGSESVKMFYITAVGTSSLTCQEAWFDGTSWTYYPDSGHQASVHKYPNFTNMSSYKVGKYIVAVKIGSYWVSAYNQPVELWEYQP